LRWRAGAGIFPPECALATKTGETVVDVMGMSIPCRIGGEPYAIGVAGPTSRLQEKFELRLAAINAAELAIRKLH
jgi:DNA-binding IclR family transcriptional regulator